MKQKNKRIIIMYSIVLVFAFILGPLLGIVQTEVIYNMTCDNGSVDYFNKTDYYVCGKQNPLHNIESDNDYGINLNINNYS